ncbi:hypothetical protein Q3G72_016141 [Acer saccharum]|nr:hypothetical protein Q3G72_016141 [Acer saccharum]
MDKGRILVLMDKLRKCPSKEGDRSSENRFDRGQVNVSEWKDKSGYKACDSNNLFSRKFKKGGSRDKGKRAYVRVPKRKPSHPSGVCGKLDLEKKRQVNCRVESGNTTSNSESEEEQMGNFSFFKGECSKVKEVGRGPMLDGPKMLKSAQDINSGSQLGGSQQGSDLGLIESTSKNSGQVSSPSDRPHRQVAHKYGSRRILVRNKEHHVVSLSDNDGRLMSLPLEGPIQLPLRDEEGIQIRGHDFREVPINVELSGVERVD